MLLVITATKHERLPLSLDLETSAMLTWAKCYPAALTMTATPMKQYDSFFK